MTPYAAIAIICANIMNRSTNQSFGTAVLAMQAGYMVRRQTWNGDFFVFRQVPSKVPHDVIPKMTSLPTVVKDVLVTRGKDLQYYHQLALVDPRSNIQSYIPTVDDMEAHDWITEPAYVGPAALEEEPTARETVGTATPIFWNPANKVVQDHRNGTIDHELTNIEREARGLAVPWTPDTIDPPGEVP